MKATKIIGAIALGILAAYLYDKFVKPRLNANA